MMDKPGPDHKHLIGLVGPCGAGKTTLANLLIKNNVPARAIGQEHSYVPYMWKRLTNPDFLVFLDASFQVTCWRKNFSWNESEYREQHYRLRHARQFADLYILTDLLSPVEVMVSILHQLPEWWKMMKIAL
jgi:deoxyadenosine/deoxycytidine kinase